MRRAALDLKHPNIENAIHCEVVARASRPGERTGRDARTPFYSAFSLPCFVCVWTSNSRSSGTGSYPLVPHG